MFKFDVKYSDKYEEILTKEELEVFRNAIKNNKKIPGSQMGEGVREVAFRVEDVTSKLLDDARKFTNKNAVDKVVRYIAMTERDHRDYWFIVAEQRYAFLDKNGKILAHTMPSNTIDGNTLVYSVEGKYDTNIEKIDGKVDAYIVNYKRLEKKVNR